MNLGITFLGPLLLLGVLAAAIPLVLHLLSSVRAQEVLFPTLRFLRTSMEKTARRRKIQHWLLLLLRAGLLALLAVGLAEPVSRAVGGWLAGSRHAAVVVVDNSFSMAARRDSTSRFAQAKADAAALLSGEDKPTLAAVVAAAGGAAPTELTAKLDSQRQALARITVDYGPAALAERVLAAAEMLEKQSIPRKAIYVFTDLQRISAEGLLAGQDLARAKDVHLFFVNEGPEEFSNVGITDLEVAGEAVVDNVLEFTATLVNSSPTDRVVEAGMRVNGVELRQRIRKTLRASGQDGSIATVRFLHRFGEPGPAAGEVFLAGEDDLALDNVRRFALDVGGRVKVLVVRGPAGTSAWGLDPAMMLQVALQPYEDPSVPWSIATTTIEAADFAPASLRDADAAFFCDVPGFSPEQAAAIARFVQAGGTAAFFLGPEVKPEAYNQRFCQEISAEGGLLPARLGQAVGEVGPAAQAVPGEWVDSGHPYLEGLYEDLADYLALLVHRYYRLSPTPQPGRTLIRLRGGDPLLMVKGFGKGRVVLFATAASPNWSNLPIAGLFLPAVTRMCLLSRQEPQADRSYLAGAQVTIRPGELKSADRTAVVVSPPAASDQEQAETVAAPLRQTPEGLTATFTETSRVGFYHWRTSGPAADVAAVAGVFAVNPHGAESRLEAFGNEAFQQALRRRGLERAYVGSSLDEVHAAAAAAAKGHNWWDVVLAGVILLLVVEAVAANRLARSREEVVPAHLNPRMAR